jgi:hypothetical protein
MNILRRSFRRMVSVLVVVRRLQVKDQCSLEPFPLGWISRSEGGKE